MAQARIVRKEIVPPTPKIVYRVELLLTPEEARVILQLIGSTNGDCKQVTAIYKELRHLNLPPETHNMHGRPGLWSPDNPRGGQGNNS